MCTQTKTMCTRGTSSLHLHEDLTASKCVFTTTLGRGLEHGEAVSRDPGARPDSCREAGATSPGCAPHFVYEKKPLFSPGPSPPPLLCGAAAPCATCPSATRAAAGLARGSDGVKVAGSEPDRPDSRVQHLLVVRLKYFRCVPFVHDMHSTNASYYGLFSPVKEENDFLLKGECHPKAACFSLSLDPARGERAARRKCNPMPREAVI